MKKIQKALSGLLAGLMLFTSVPVNALPLVTQDSTTEIIETVEEDNSPEIATENNQETQESTQEVNEEESYPEIISEDTSTNETAKNDTDNTEESLTPSNEMGEKESSIVEDNATISSEENSEETEETDNWEISLRFYDSSINGGNTPLQKVDWDASDGNYDFGTQRQIVLQINYRNTNATKEYAPGEISIRVPYLEDYSGSFGGYISCPNKIFSYSKIEFTVNTSNTTHVSYPTVNRSINKYFTSIKYMAITEKF